MKKFVVTTYDCVLLMNRKYTIYAETLEHAKKLIDTYNTIISIEEVG